MKVSLASAHWPPRLSGYGDYASQLAVALARRGVDIEALVLGQDEVDPLGLRVKAAPLPATPPALRAAARAISSRRPDVVLLQFEANAFRSRALPHLLPALLRARGIRVALTYHELWAPKRLRRTMKLALLNAPHRVVVSTDWHAAGVARFRRIGGPADVIPVPSSVARVPAERALVRAQFGLPESARVVVFFGFVGPQHLVEKVVETLSRLRENGEDVRLSMIGDFDLQRSGYHQRLLAQARALDVSEAITWHGRVDDPAAVSRLLTAADAGLLPYEAGVGGNNAAFAALAAHGLPVVTTGGPRSREIDQEGVALFAEPTADALAAAMRRLLENQQLARETAERAEAWAERRSWDRVAEAYERVLEPGSGRVVLE
jgi:glycosyltransferase involved in cell wall biosynthesis